MTRPLILIVDDNAMSLELVSFLLDANGLDVDTAPNVAAARMRIDVRRPDLILMDIQLPGVDGLTFTQQLKSDPATQAIPIVAFTAYAMKRDEMRMREAGCVGFLTKPIDVKGFSARVKAYLQTGMAADF
jgi:CheY-like chemotaxis protein